MSRRMGTIGIALLLAATVTGCRSSEFSTLVSAVGSEPGARRQHIPMLGLARIATRAVHPEGVRDLQLAVFETDSAAASERLDRAIESVGQGWMPMIRVSSANGERSTVWVRPAGDGMEMLVLAHEPGESVIVRLEMDPERFFATMSDSPRALADTRHGD